MSASERTRENRVEKPCEHPAFAREHRQEPLNHPYEQDDHTHGEERVAVGKKRFARFSHVSPLLESQEGYQPIG